MNFSLGQLVSFTYKQFLPLPVVTESLRGKRVILTGGNVGIGFETAMHLARLEPELLIVACRSLDKGNAAVTEIRLQTGCTTVECWQLDLSSYQSVQQFSKRYLDLNKPLDILIENAGVARASYMQTADGHENSIQTNWLSHAYLVFLLLDVLKKSPKPKLAVVASEAHERISPSSDMSIQSLDDRKNFSDQRYPETKLLNIFFVHAFAKRYPEIGITVINPGLCSSSLSRDIDKLGFKVMLFALGRTSEVGSRNTLWAIFRAPGRGEYVDSCGVGQTSEFSRSTQGQELQEKLWKEMAQELTRVDSSIRNAIRA